MLHSIGKKCFLKMDSNAKRHWESEDPKVRSIDLALLCFFSVGCTSCCVFSWKKVICFCLQEKKLKISLTNIGYGLKKTRTFLPTSHPKPPHLPGDDLHWESMGCMSNWLLTYTISLLPIGGLFLSGQNAGRRRVWYLHGAVRACVEYSEICPWFFLHSLYLSWTIIQHKKR